MENQKKSLAKQALITGSIVAGTLLSASAFASNSNHFSYRNLGDGASIRHELTGGAASNLFVLDGGCGKKDSTKTKSKDGKCGEGKCGGAKGKKAEKKDPKGKGN